MNKICMSCKQYRPEDERRGRCRVDRKEIGAEDYPVMEHEKSCSRWQDAGQRYYIRVGWLKKLKSKDRDDKE